MLPVKYATSFVDIVPAPSSEIYSIVIDSSVRSKDAIFSRVTDVAFLGYSTFNGWDAFYDMLSGRLNDSDIIIQVANADLSGLSIQDRTIWLSLLDDLRQEFPTKLNLVRGYDQA